MHVPSSADADALVALLRWYADMGVDWTVDETPHDRFAEHVEKKPEQEIRPEPPMRRDPDRQPRPAASQSSSTTLEAAERSAREMAAAAATLEELREALERFEGCGLKRTASRLVFADGNPQARVMLVGEAPGAEEDRSGLPFVGRAGQLLDRMLAAIALDRTQVYIANVVPWRPPGNRTPTPQETTVCLPFLRRQIALVSPDFLVALGGAAAQSLFGLKEGVMRARGSWRAFEVGMPEGLRRIPALITLHPAYLLRTSSAKRLAWRDLRALRKAIDEGRGA